MSVGEVQSRLEALLEDIRVRLERLEAKLKVEPTAVEFQEAARMLSCSPRHIARMVAQRQLRVVMVGSLRRISVESIRDMATRAVEPVSKSKPSRVKYSVAAELAKFKASRRSR